MFAEMARREDGESALFSALGHKGDSDDRSFSAQLRGTPRTPEQAVAGLALSDYLEPTTSYLSVIEIGLYEATVALYRKLIESGVGPHSPQWKSEIESELERQREKISPRSFPSCPARPYLCFYPMDKNVTAPTTRYRLPIEDRQRLMHDHGMVGRRFAGEVTQIISGSIEALRRLGMGGRPVRRRSDRVQETRLRDALRRGERVVRKVRSFLCRHPPRAGRAGQTLLGLIENLSAGACRFHFVARQRQLDYNAGSHEKSQNRGTA